MRVPKLRVPKVRVLKVELLDPIGEKVRVLRVESPRVESSKS